MFFMKVVQYFNRNYSRVYSEKLYYRQMVAQLAISKEMYIFHSCFQYVVHPLYI